MKLNGIIVFLALLAALCSCGGKPPVVPDPDPGRTFDTDVPDKEGYSVKGLVSCNGKPVVGVVVSDGVNVTQTNLEGKYWMKTDSRSDFVFLSIPSGYEVSSKANRPQFYARFDSTATASQRFDFTLEEVPQDSYELLVLTDIHICARITPLGLDSDRFSRKAVTDILDYVATRPSGTRFYGLSLGDMVQDDYIAESGFPEFFTVMSPLDFPVFYTVGNHDHLPDAPLADGEDARNLKAYYMQHCGPTYYSFNLGSIHYVVLDNNMMLGGGTNKYRNRVTAKQLAWLEKDLAKVDKSMGLVICMHMPIVRNGGTESLKVIGTCENYQDIANACSGFSKVEIFTGHSHFAEVVNWSDRFTETVHPSACGVWWLSTYCHDGTPASYTVYEVEGKNMHRNLMAYDFPSHPQMLVHSEGVTDPEGNPCIQINIPFYENGWTLSVSEDGTEVAQARRVHGPDWRYEHVEFPAQPAFQQKYDTVKPLSTWHIFYYTPLNPSAKLQIVATDRYGARYQTTTIIQ